MHFYHISTKPFSSPDVPPTIEQIFHSFGDTRPGGVRMCKCFCSFHSLFIIEYDEVRKVYLLNFRGVVFSFTETKGNANVYRVSYSCGVPI